VRSSPSKSRRQITDERALVASPNIHLVQTLRAGVQDAQPAYVCHDSTGDTSLSDQPPTTT